MPHIRIRGMKKNEIQQMSTELIDELSEIIKSPRDYFTIEHIESTFIFDGALGGNRYPFVNVDWFAREEDVRTKTVETITRYIKKFEYDCIAVYFTDLIEKNYFENGEHF